MTEVGSTVILSRGLGDTCVRTLFCP